ncbi:MAG TPA: LPS export ABC transporter permease LptG, partial [Gammaproteobacteria bacterium]
MKILDIYIARTIFAGALLALAVLAALDLFFAVIGEFEDVGKGIYSYRDALIYVGLTLPRRLYELFPAAVLVGSLLSLGTLAGNSELVAMRAAGISVRRIMRSAAQAGLILLVLVAVLGEFLVPPAERYAKEVASRKEGMNISHSVRHGFWVREGEYFLQIEKVYPDARLESVYIHHYDEPDRLLSSAYVESVLQQRDHWELRKIYRTRFGPDKVEREFSEIEKWRTLLNPKVFDVLSIEPSVMSARDLFEYVNYLKRNKLDAAT